MRAARPRAAPRRCGWRACSSWRSASRSSCCRRSPRARISSRVGRYGARAERARRAPGRRSSCCGATPTRSRCARAACSVSPAQTGKLLWEARGWRRLDLDAPTRARGAAGAARRDAAQARAQAARAGERRAKRDVKAALPAGLRRAAARQRRRPGRGARERRPVRRRRVRRRGRRGERRQARRAPARLPARRLQLTLFSDPHVYVEGRRRAQAAGGRAATR